MIQKVSPLHKELGKVPPDGFVRAAGPVSQHMGKTFVPLEPSGCVPLGMFVKAEGLPREP